MESSDIESVFYNISELLPVPKNGCVAIKVHACKLGHTEVQAVFEQGKTKLTASITIAAYKPLKVCRIINVLCNFKLLLWSVLIVHLATVLKIKIEFGPSCSFFCQSNFLFRISNVISDMKYDLMSNNCNNKIELGSKRYQLSIHYLMV